MKGNVDRRKGISEVRLGRVDGVAPHLPSLRKEYLASYSASQQEKCGRQHTSAVRQQELNDAILKLGVNEE